MKRNMKQKGRDLLSLALCAAMLLSMMAFPAAAQEMTEQNQEEASSTNFDTITTEGAANTGTATETPITEGEITESEITSTTDSSYTLNTPLLNSAYYGTELTSDYKDLLSDPISDGCVYSFVNAGSGMYMTSTDNSAVYTYTCNIYQDTVLSSPVQAFRLDATDDGYHYIIPLDYGQTEAYHVGAYIEGIKNDDGSYISNGIANVTYNQKPTSATIYIYEYKWRFERVEGSEDAYRIYMADTNYVLTALDNNVGSYNLSNTSGTYSRGNIVVAPLNVMNERQIWHLESGGQRMYYGINLRETSSTTDNTVNLEICTATLNTPHFSYPASQYGDYITGINSSNTNVISIDEVSRIATEKSPGFTTISCVEYNSQNNPLGYSYINVYCYLPRGMYYFTTPDNMYVLNCPDTISDTATYYNIKLLAHSGNEPTDRQQLFELIYIGQGRYCISLMEYKNIVWYKVSSVICLHKGEIPENYNSLSSDRIWTINTDSNGCYIYCGSTSSALTAPTVLATGNSPTLATFSSGDGQYWNITKANFLSGYELPNQPEKWNDTINVQGRTFIPMCYNNCYSYMLNLLTYNRIYCHFKLQPGQYDNINNSIWEGFTYLQIEKLIEAVYEDSVNADFIFAPIGQYEVPPQGTYKVALIYGVQGYHWYRQNSDGTWSHKPGNLEVTSFDLNGEIILDPMYAAHDPHYPKLYGYFYVKPPSSELYITSVSNQ